MMVREWDNVKNDPDFKHLSSETQTLVKEKHQKYVEALEHQKKMAEFIKQNVVLFEIAKKLKLP